MQQAQMIILLEGKLNKFLQSKFGHYMQNECSPQVWVLGFVIFMHLGNRLKKPIKYKSSTTHVVLKFRSKINGQTAKFAGK